MTNVFFVRYAQPVHSHADDRTRPLTEEGIADTKIVLKTLTFLIAAPASICRLIPLLSHPFCNLPLPKRNLPFPLLQPFATLATIASQTRAA